MGKTPLFEVLTDTEYVRPPIGPLTLSCPGCPLGVLLVLGIHISLNNGPMDMIPSGKLIYYVSLIHFACSIM
jgi:hypothetical protein